MCYFVHARRLPSVQLSFGWANMFIGGLLYRVMHTCISYPLIPEKVTRSYLIFRLNAHCAGLLCWSILCLV
uniref:Uncharacterized protein n=1 Tax=Arundo donax TaxID=35708 RepID=A0A0A9BZC7_ARUDO